MFRILTSSRYQLAAAKALLREVDPPEHLHRDGLVVTAALLPCEHPHTRNVTLSGVNFAWGCRIPTRRRYF